MPRYNRVWVDFILLVENCWLNSSQVNENHESYVAAAVSLLKGLPSIVPLLHDTPQQGLENTRYTQRWQSEDLLLASVPRDVTSFSRPCSTRNLPELCQLNVKMMIQFQKLWLS